MIFYYTHKDDLGGHLDNRVFYRTGQLESLFGSAIQRCMVRDCHGSVVHDSVFYRSYSQRMTLPLESTLRPPKGQLQIENSFY